MSAKTLKYGDLTLESLINIPCTFIFFLLNWPPVRSLWGPYVKLFWAIFPSCTFITSCLIINFKHLFRFLEKIKHFWGLQDACCGQKRLKCNITTPTDTYAVITTLPMTTTSKVLMFTNCKNLPFFPCTFISACTFINFSLDFLLVCLL